MFVQIFPVCVIIHTLSSFPTFLPSLSFPLFCLFQSLGRISHPHPHHNQLIPLLHVCHHTLFFSLSGDIYFCLVYYLHIAHNLCLLISRAVLYLHSLPASCPIFLLSAPFISLSMSQCLLITTLLISPPHTHTHNFWPPSSFFFHSFIHSERWGNIWTEQCKMQIWAQWRASLYFTLHHNPYIQYK